MALMHLVEEGPLGNQQRYQPPSNINHAIIMGYFITPN